MKFGEIPVEEAEGAILAHSARECSHILWPLLDPRSCLWPPAGIGQPDQVV